MSTGLIRKVEKHVMANGPRIPPIALAAFVVIDLIIVAVVVWWFAFR